MNLISIDVIQALYSARSIFWTDHVLKRLRERGIQRDGIKHCIMTGKVIEEYPDDYPYPSCLILGCTVDLKPLHVVVGIGNGLIWIISAYYPNPDEWNEDFSARRK